MVGVAVVVEGEGGFIHGDADEQVIAVRAVDHIGDDLHLMHAGHLQAGGKVGRALGPGPGREEGLLPELRLPSLRLEELR